MLFADAVLAPLMRFARTQREEESVGRGHADAAKALSELHTGLGPRAVKRSKGVLHERLLFHAGAQVVATLVASSSACPASPQGLVQVVQLADHAQRLQHVEDENRPRHPSLLACSAPTRNGQCAVVLPVQELGELARQLLNELPERVRGLPNEVHVDRMASDMPPVCQDLVVLVESAAREVQPDAFAQDLVDRCLP